jgi:hypothetical protein
MGNCLKKPTNEIHEEQEVPVVFKESSSSFDKYYKKIENEYNFLKFFQFYEFLLLLGNLKTDSPQNVTEKAYLQELDKGRYCLFVDNKILKNYLIYAQTMENETNTAIFRDYLIELYDTMLKASIDLYKKKNNLEKVKKGTIVTLKKLYIMAVGLLYCAANNRTKMNFFLNLFLNDKGEFELNEHTHDFLFFLFIVPSTSSLRAVKNIGEKYDNFGKIPDEEFLKIYDNFEVADILRLKEIFVKDFFKGKITLSKAEFEKKFIDEDFGWIFTPSGIRGYLEKHNDKKEES